MAMSLCSRVEQVNKMLQWNPMPASFRVFDEGEISAAATLSAASLAIIEHAFSALAEGRVIMPAPLGLHIKEDKVDGEVHVKTAYITREQGICR
jgi:hypothetical protein